MKSHILTFILLLSSAIYSQDDKRTTAQFLVSGNCEMCQKTIEEALLVKGVKKASWNMDTHILTVTFIPAKITINDLHKLVAMSGYDTDQVKADSATYSKLPQCCKYRSK